MGPRLTRTYTPSTPRPSSDAAPTRRSRLGAGTSSWRSAPPQSVLSEATARRAHSDRDMRRKRPPSLSFLLRMATARRLARVVSLLALDFAGVALAIFTALILKALVLNHV